jgi:hypothetical protein
VSASGARFLAERARLIMRLPVIEAPSARGLVNFRVDSNVATRAWRFACLVDEPTASPTATGPECRDVRVPPTA